MSKRGSRERCEENKNPSRWKVDLRIWVLSRANIYIEWNICTLVGRQTKKPRRSWDEQGIDADADVLRKRPPQQNTACFYLSLPQTSCRACWYGGRRGVDILRPQGLASRPSPEGNTHIVYQHSRWEKGGSMQTVVACLWCPVMVVKMSFP